jgi:hypothetical protein
MDDRETGCLQVGLQSVKIWIEAEDAPARSLGRYASSHKTHMPMEAVSDEREIRDLSDFCQQWTGLRELVGADDLARSGLSQQQQDVVNWLARAC